MVKFLADFLYIILHIICIVLPLIAVVAYLTLVERKVLGLIQGRIGPNRVGPFGLLQPIADVMKLFLKEYVIPTKANSYLFLSAPVLVLAPSLAAWAVIPFGSVAPLANINIGLLYILTLTSASVYGIIIAGWSSNSKYALLGALRSVAQVVSYEIAMGLSLVGVLLLSGTMNLTQIVNAQSGGVTTWFWLPLFPLFVIYWISAMAETNRAPFDVAEGESELVAGFHVEYGGIIFGLFFLAEYMNMVLVSVLASLLFLGGWLSPFEGIASIDQYLNWVPKIGWLLLKSSLFLFLFLWSRATFPRYRYDQIMRLCWKIFIPIATLWLCIISVVMFKR